MQAINHIPNSACTREQPVLVGADSRLLQSSCPRAISTSLAPEGIAGPAEAVLCPGCCRSLPGPAEAQGVRQELASAPQRLHSSPPSGSFNEWVRSQVFPSVVPAPLCDESPTPAPHRRRTPASPTPSPIPAAHQPRHSPLRTRPARPPGAHSTAAASTAASPSPPPDPIAAVPFRSPPRSA